MYYVFAFDRYYPEGGARDLVYWSDDLNDCIEKGLNKYRSYDFVEVWGQDDAHGLVKEWSVIG